MDGDASDANDEIPKLACANEPDVEGVPNEALYAATGDALGGVASADVGFKDGLASRPRLARCLGVLPSPSKDGASGLNLNGMVQVIPGRHAVVFAHCVLRWGVGESEWRLEGTKEDGAG